MDFSYLLELAKQNDQNNASQIKPKSCKSNEKKVKKEPKSEAVQALLKKKVEKQLEYDIKFRKERDNLLSLRAQDKKSRKRVSAMINRTLGANKSVLEDAKDLSTKVAEAECDEDDYGYESTMSQQIFSKLTNQYREIPEDERLKFKKMSKGNIQDIKNRVINSLKDEENEKLGPRKRKKKSKRSDGQEDVDDGFINDGDAYKEFRMEKKEGSNATERDRGSERKSDGDEKHRKHKHKKDTPKIPTNINVTNYSSKKYSHFKYDKNTKESKGRDDKEEKKKKKVSAPPPLSFEELLKMAKKKSKEAPELDDPLAELEKKREEKEKMRPLTAKEKEEAEEERLRKLRREGKLPPLNPKANHEKPEEKEKSEHKKDKTRDSIKEKSQPQKSTIEKKKTKKDQEFTPNIGSSKFFATSAQKPIERTKLTNNPDRQLIQSTSNRQPIQNPSDRQFSKPNQLFDKNKTKPSKFNNHSFNSDKSHYDRKPAPKSLRVESDDEYDSEMDDFIDDGDAGMNYSEEIARMFQYDKSKYRDDEDDLSDMEASYTQMQKEEKISAKIGLQEDMEDMRMEEEARKRKLKRKRLMEEERRKR